VPSTIIRSFDYDPAAQELRIAFRSDRHYVYSDVPPEVFAAMKQAYSKGEFFNAHVRDRFPFKEEIAGDGRPTS
jgi:hypothetical protein